MQVIKKSYESAADGNRQFIVDDANIAPMIQRDIEIMLQNKFEGQYDENLFNPNIFADVSNSDNLVLGGKQVAKSANFEIIQKKRSNKKKG